MMSVPRVQEIAELANSIGDWFTIDDLARAAIEQGWFEEFRQVAFEQYVKVQLRRMIRRVKDETGFPEYSSIVQLDSGKSVRLYKPETLFDLDDYVQVVKYWKGKSSYADAMVMEYAKRCKMRYGVNPLFEQQSLDFGPESGELAPGDRM